MLAEPSILQVRQGCVDLTIAVDHNVRLLDERPERGVAVRDLLREHRRDVRKVRITNAITEADGRLHSLRHNGAGLRHQIVKILFRCFRCM